MNYPKGFHEAEREFLAPLDPPEPEIVECEDCQGDGMISVGYEDTTGKHHDLDVECPCCEGSGEIEKKEG